MVNHFAGGYLKGIKHPGFEKVYSPESEAALRQWADAVLGGASGPDPEALLAAYPKEEGQWREWWHQRVAAASERDRSALLAFLWRLLRDGGSSSKVFGLTVMIMIRGPERVELAQIYGEAPISQVAALAVAGETAEIRNLAKEVLERDRKWRQSLKRKSAPQ